MSSPVRRSVNQFPRPEATRAAAARLFAVPAAVVARVECWPHVVLVVFAKGLGLRPQFVSYTRFAVDAADLRIESATRIAPSAIAVLGGGCFSVIGSRGDRYLVDLPLEVCTCPDQTYRHTTCRHMRAAAAYSAVVQRYPERSPRLAVPVLLAMGV